MQLGNSLLSAKLSFTFSLLLFSSLPCYHKGATNECRFIKMHELYMNLFLNL